MRETHFFRLVHDEFGTQYGDHLIRTHVLSDRNQTVAESMADPEVDLRELWWALCRDFDVPEERHLGRDD